MDRSENPNAALGSPAGSGYPASERTRSQRQFIKWSIPPLVGLAVVGRGVALLGWRSAVLAIAVGVLLSLGVLIVAKRLSTRPFRRIERGGALLASAAAWEYDDRGQLRDTNHRTQSEIAEGDTGQLLQVRGRVEACVDRLHLVVAQSRRSHEHGPGDVVVPVTSIAAAEVLHITPKRCIMVLHMRSGARHRLSLHAGAGRVAAALRAMGVADPVAPAPGDFRVGDVVHTADGATGTVAALVDRPGEPGHAEVFVKMCTGGVDSWDSTQLTHDTGVGNKPTGTRPPD